MAKTRNIAKQDIVIAELVKGATKQEAAAKAGINPDVPRNWERDDPDYRERLEAEREKARAKYTRAVSRAADVAIAALDAEDVSDQLAAVKLINDRALGPVNAPSVQITQNTIQITPVERARLTALSADDLAAIYLTEAKLEPGS